MDIKKKSYYDEFFSRLQNYDTEAAMQLLHSIFHDPVNQRRLGKPSDFLSSAPHSADQLGIQFDKMVADFNISEPVAKRVELIIKALEGEIKEEELRNHAFAPFNALVFSMDDFDFGSAAVGSFNYDHHTKELKKVFQLDLPVITERDSFRDKDTQSESYDFIDDLKKKKYEIRYQGDVLEGANLHVHIKLLLFTTIIKEIVDGLLEDEQFARFPKSFPFHILVSSKELFNYTEVPFLVPVMPPIQLEQLASGKYYDLFLEASTVRAASIENEFLYKLSLFAKDDETACDDLASFLHENTQFRTIVFDTATLALKQMTSGVLQPSSLSGIHEAVIQQMEIALPVRCAELFWTMDELYPGIYRQQAVQFQTELLNFQPPDLSLTYKAAILEATLYAELLEGAFWVIPEKMVEDFETLYEDALDRLLAHQHPAYRILAAELLDAFEDGRPSTDGNNLLSEPPATYLQDLIDLISHMPAVFEGYGDSWTFLFGRLEEAGKKAIKAVPAIEALLYKYNQHRFDQQMTGTIAATLHKIGCLHVPGDVHRAHQSNPYFMPFYKEWSVLAPGRKWKNFLNAFKKNEAAFYTANAWETHLYDSIPGFSCYFDSIQLCEEKELVYDALLKALEADPVDLLVRYSLHTADMFRKRSASTNVEFFENAGKIAAILLRIANLPEHYQELLEDAEVALTFREYINARESAAPIINRTLVKYPRNPLLLFLNLRLTEEKGGVIRTMELLPAVLSTIWNGNADMQKALSVYCMMPDTLYTGIPADRLFAFYQASTQCFQERFYSDGKLNTRWTDFRSDPFREVLKNHDANHDGQKQNEFLASQASAYHKIAEVEFSGPEMLVAALQPGNFSTTLILVDKLLPHAFTFSKELLGTLQWKHTEEELFMLCKRFYTHPVLQSLLILNEIFHKHLGYFIQHYRDTESRQTIRLIFEKLLQAGKAGVIVQLLPSLTDKQVKECTISIQKAFVAEKQFPLLAERLESIRLKSDPANPDYVLTCSNLAVVHGVSGFPEKAMEILEGLFQMDWRRFNYVENESDSMMSDIMGVNLDQQYAKVFKTYYGMAYFNAACFSSKLAALGKALEYLKKAVSLQPDKYVKEKILADSDFKGLAEYKPFKAFLKTLK